MLVNGINISNFKAKLMDRNIGNAKFNIENDWSANSLNPFVSKRLGYEYKPLSFTLDIVCNNANELETMKSNIIKQLTKSTIKFDDIDFYYSGFVVGEPSFKFVMKGNETLEVNMLVIAEKEPIIELFNRIATKTINVVGNTETPCIVEITPSIDIIDITITGAGDSFSIKNLKAGQKVIVDGEAGTVTCNGTNIYSETDMWEFPKLSPGANTIAFSKNSCDITIKYKPRWI